MQPGSARDERDDKFLLQLYGQLWDNIKSKETRVWTFLSVYGASVGLVIAGTRGDISTSAQLFALTIVTGLTVWAVLIVLDANWWMSRNLLLISRVEQRFPNAVKGVVPALYYKNPTFRFNSLYAGSILVLGVLFIALQGQIVWLFLGKGGVGHLEELSALAVLYLLSNIAVIYCVQRQDRLARVYFDTKRDLLDDVGDLKPSKLKGLLKEDLDYRKKNDVRDRLVVILVALSLIFDLAVYSTYLSPLWLVLTIVCQGLSIWIFWQQRDRCLRRDLDSELDQLKIDDDAVQNQALDALGKKITVYPRKLWDNHPKLGSGSGIFAVLTLVAVLASAMSLICAKPQLLAGLTGATSTSLRELVRKIDESEKGIQSARSSLADTRALELQRKVIQQSLSVYLNRADAMKSYDELRQRVENLKQDLARLEKQTKELEQRSNTQSAASSPSTSP